MDTSGAISGLAGPSKKRQRTIIYKTIRFFLLFSVSRASLSIIAAFPMPSLSPLHLQTSRSHLQARGLNSANYPSLSSIFIVHKGLRVYFNARSYCKYIVARPRRTVDGDLVKTGKKPLSLTIEQPSWSPFWTPSRRSTKKTRSTNQPFSVSVIFIEQHQRGKL